MQLLISASLTALKGLMLLHAARLDGQTVLHLFLGLLLRSGTPTLPSLSLSFSLSLSLESTVRQLRGVTFHLSVSCLSTARSACMYAARTQRLASLIRLMRTVL
jgi:hypothetical protein